MLLAAPATICAELYEAGAFDVIEDGSDAALDRGIVRVLATARRFFALREERVRLTKDLAHQDRLSALAHVLISSNEMLYLD